MSEQFLVISGPWIRFQSLLLDWSEIWYSWLLFWSSWGLSGLAGALLLGLLVSAAAFWGFLALSGGFLGLSWSFLGSSGVSNDFCVLAL